jgi:hypothetical protein
MGDGSPNCLKPVAFVFVLVSSSPYPVLDIVAVRGSPSPPKMQTEL